jgi:hypothetical protein
MELECSLLNENVGQIIPLVFPNHGRWLAEAFSHNREILDVAGGVEKVCDCSDRFRHYARAIRLGLWSMGVKGFPRSHSDGRNCQS